jgi:hypothetical protein
MIYQTQNYNLFDRQHANRPINRQHVQKLINSMEKYGFLETYHIVVTPNMEIIDGQHRLEAAIFLDIPVFYAIQENVDHSINRELNATNRKWGKTDYLSSYVDDGYEEYKKLQNFMAETGLPLSVFTTISSTTRNDDYKKGRYTFPTDKAHLSALTAIRTLCKIEKFTQDRFSVLALVRLSKLDGFDIDLFLKKVETYPSKVTKCHNTQSYFDMYLDLYNYRARLISSRIGG